jgi:hypothetical protein
MQTATVPAIGTLCCADTRSECTPSPADNAATTAAAAAAAVTTAAAAADQSHEKREPAGHDDGHH